MWLMNDANSCLMLYLASIRVSSEDHLCPFVTAEQIPPSETEKGGNQYFFFFLFLCSTFFKVCSSELL